MTRLAYSEASELKTNPNIAISVRSGLSSTTFIMQTRDKLPSNVKLRQGIAAAIDYDELVGSATYGLTTPNNAMVPVTSPFHTDVQKKGYRHDPALVKKLLQEAGYKGIKAEVEVLEWGVQTDRWQSGNYQIMAFSYYSRMDPALNYEAVIGPKDTQPRKVWKDKAAIDALAAVTDETRTAERQKLFDRLHSAMIEQAPLIPLYSTITAGASRKTVKGFRSNVFSAPLLWEVRKD